MISVAFQLAGSLLLSWMIITRSKKDILRSCWLVLNEEIIMKKVACRKFKEKYLSMFGFLYIAGGYIIQLVDFDRKINAWLLMNNPLNKYVDLGQALSTFINMLSLFAVGLIVSIILSRISCKKLSAEDFTKNTPTNSMYLQADEHGISFKTK